MSQDLEQLFVECKSCGLEFATPEFADPHGPEPFEPRILGNTVVYDCPHCGTEATYHRSDHHLAAA